MANIADIEEIVQTWAWTAFQKTRSKDVSKLKLEDVKLDVNWSRVRFFRSEPEFSDGQMVELPNSQIVFTSTFINNTEQDQEHSFKTERTTTSVSTVTVSKGYSKGFNLELKLALPEEVAAVTAGFGREVNMDNTEESAHEESITWAVDSTVKVPRKTTTTAEMVVKEKQFNSNYRMPVKIRGTVIVAVLNLKDNNSFVQSVEGDFSVIMGDELKRARSGYQVENKTVTFLVEGSCKFRFGVEQRVQLKEKPTED
ncbi:uncharacterized protein LOC110447870 [Mizuhopecten yessoensis]|uniref:Uncharacterized protein n=1 Tax=Mizuhopecten yessoensis TaxID=6573 RepID=A0A210QUI1_MIZYE|nr:uncharacterized protein LOC110447870 [Mizuhopecten yessoensis]OWF52400.1 hypothetical protein KP79_PYT18568 [Mizuhopecten yessoensis]